MKTVLITGAAGAIGAATVERFLDQGCRVGATDISEERLEVLQRRFPAAVAQRALVLTAMNVASQAAVDQSLTILLGEMKGIDVLVNNAGIFDISAFLDLNEERFLGILNINLLGAFRVALSVSKEMVKRGAGRIVNVGSVAGLKGASGAAHYAASKAGLGALSASMAIELAAHNIQVNLVIPGYVDTPMMSGLTGKMHVLAAWRVPSKRLAMPADVAEVISMLAMLETSYVTGAELLVDGGYVRA